MHCRFLALILLAAAPTFAAEPEANPAEARLRESLRATMLQLRTAETERAALQGEKVIFEEKIQSLTEQLEKSAKDAEMKQKAAVEAMAALDQRLQNQAGQIAELQQSLAKWKKSQQEAVALAQATEEKRKRAAAEVVVLQRKVADHQARNAGMYRLGIEILDRYAKFGLGTALTAREPFVGLTRVKFENLIQDYGEKLTGEKIKP
jgi:hypothetical protein